MVRPEKFGTGPVTPEELEEVFGFVLMVDYAFLVERAVPPEQVGLLHLPDSVRRDRQTGATGGEIIQMGPEAEQALNERLQKMGKGPIKVGDRIMFSLYAPKPLGLIDPDTGMPILPGFDSSAYAGIELIHKEDVLGWIPKERLKR